MLSLDSLSNTIQRVNFTEKVDSVLSVDAFSATYLMKITDQKLTSNDEIEYKMILNASKDNFEKLFNKPSDYDKQFENVNINIQDSMKGENFNNNEVNNYYNNNDFDNNNFDIVYNIDNKYDNKNFETNNNNADNANNNINNAINNSLKPSFSENSSNRVAHSIHFNKYECKNVFLFLLLPIRTDIKPIILFLKPSKSGSANSEIHSIISVILKTLRKSCFNVRYVSCDGDRFYNSILFIRWLKIKL